MSVHYLGLALLHFAWQGAAVAAMLAGLELLLRPRSPRVRYALAAATLLGMLALPAATYLVLSRGTSLASSSGAGQPGETPISREAVTPEVEAAASRPGQRLAPWLPALVLAWSLGVGLFSVRLFGGLAVVFRLKGSATPAIIPGLGERFRYLCAELRLARPVRLCESALVEVPTVVGWLRPVILLPVGAALGLSPAQLETILAHELAHIRRFDALASLGQAVAETLLFYHPAVWWVSRRMRVEREHCCDDVAVAICGDAVSYARALTHLAQGRPGPAALALAATGGSLFQRIVRLVGPAPPEASSRARGVAVLVILSSLTALGLSTAVSAPRPADPGKSSPQGTSTPKSGPAQPGRKVPRPEAPESEGTVAGEAGHGLIPLGKVIALADAGVTAEYIDEMAALGFPALSPNQLLELSSEGIDPDFVRDMKKGSGGDLSLMDLVALHSYGVTAEGIAEFEGLGIGKLSVARLIGLASAGVTPEYAREMKGLLDETLSLPLLIEMHSHGVTTEFVGEMKDLGYGGLSAQMWIELVDNGVDSDYVRELKGAGYAKLTVRDLVELRAHGVEVELLKRLTAARQESAE